ncbi:unnamed protein product [Adineta steineri]|uniref:Uncharacterized protein n=1 Tax=Adineta steineri TaxID=433720 RepID=A0A818QJD2_9BILA|nr:unnamed protein product [Adineta steineri]CAF3638100.1 unnamed protein product [Adineta steineri]
MLLSVYSIGIFLIVFILTTESAYNVFTYDGDDEHCCLVQINRDFCWAKPLTRSLIQVNKRCQPIDLNEKPRNYLNKVIRRLNVETSTKLGDKILIELEKPLDEDILKNNLLCLTPDNNNNINLDKCHIVLANIESKKRRRKTKNTTIAEEQSDIELTEPIKISQGHGVSVFQSYELDLTDYKPTTRQHRRAWSWYRTQTRKMCSQPLKYTKNCIRINRHNKKYVEHLLNQTTSNNDDDDEQQSTYKITKGSKLYCENNREQTKLIGFYNDSKICFEKNNQLYIKHDFTDYVSLSDRKKNMDILQFIANNTKLTDEFEHDCDDKITLADIQKSSEEEPEAEAEADLNDNPST